MNSNLAFDLFEKSGFFAKMLEELQKSDNKQPQNQTLNDLGFVPIVKHFREEYEEVENEIAKYFNHKSFPCLQDLDYEQFLKEITHLANMCGFMFIKVKSMKDAGI